MPRFYEDHPRGYDLDLELSFYEAEGVKYCLGSVGSFIMVCEACGSERFRDRLTSENCFCGHGLMVPLTFENMTKIPLPDGSRETTIEERRDMRLKAEAENPWRWIFGEKTEADYPRGFVK